MQHDSTLHSLIQNADGFPCGQLEITFENKPFTFEPRTRVVFGAGTFSQLGELAQSIGGENVLLVSDPGIVQAGHTQRGIDLLVAAGLRVTTFEEFTPNPTTDDVEQGLAVARSAKIDLIVGLGGGSSMDCAKGINFLLTNGGN